MAALPIDTDQIVITASRAPQNEAQTPASITLIDRQRIERLDEPLLSALLRLTPSASVSTSGPGGSLTEVRIRGAEANHTLLFVDGIKIDDPASGDTPRYEILNADLASRIEVVRGPQSALWGSEAMGESSPSTDSMTHPATPPAPRPVRSASFAERRPVPW